MRSIAALLACLLLGVQADDSTVTLSTTATVVIAVPSTTTVEVTKPTTVFQTTSLPVSTHTTLESAEIPTVTMSDAGKTVTVTGTVTQVVTSAAGSVVWITVTAPASSTVFVTATGTQTATATVQSGYTTIATCVPTTTIVVTTTTPAPVPTSPPGPTVTYQKQSCTVVSCPNNEATAVVNGVTKTCYLTLYGGDLVSSTCISDYCCSPKSSGSGSTTTVRSTNCRSAAVTCPSGCTLLTSTSGSAVPCLETYKNNKLVSTTCDTSVCCSSASTTTAAATTSSTSCKSGVKCSVYKKDPTTNYILKCSGSQCTTAYCCSKV